MQRAHYDALIAWCNIAAEMGMTSHVQRDGHGRLTIAVEGWLLDGLREPPQ